MKSVLILAILFAIVSLVNADSCISYPASLKKGANCGVTNSDDVISCQQGNYCGTSGTCIPFVAVSAACTSDSQCGAGARCKGNTGSQICVTNANPGEVCSNGVTNTTGTCPFNCNNFICTGGEYGDGCTADFHCMSGLMCQNNVCTSFTNNSCIASIQCQPQFFCRQNLCIANKIEGDCSTVTCEYGYGCSGTAAGDEPQCVKYGSRKTGDFCNGDGRLCDSNRCVNGRCSRRNLGYCMGSGQCGVDSFCGCDSISLSEGYGQCQKNPCWSKYLTLEKCMAQNCKVAMNNQFTYTNSCQMKQCSKESSSYIDCSPAMKITAPFISIVLGFLIVSFFNKK